MSKTANKPIKGLNQVIKLERVRSPSNYKVEYKAKSPKRKSTASNVRTLLKNRFTEQEQEKEVLSRSKDKTKIRFEEKSVKKTRKAKQNGDNSKNASTKKNGRIILNMPSDHRVNDFKLKQGISCKTKNCDYGEIEDLVLQEPKKKKDLEKEIRDLKKKLKKYKLVKDEKPTLESHNIVKNKIICINTNYHSKEKSKPDASSKGIPHTEMLDSRKKSVNSVKTPNILKEQSLHRKTKIKAEIRDSLIHSKNKNSLKDLLELYNKLKNPRTESKEGLDVNKLKKLKLKISGMYKVIEEKLKDIKEEKPRGVIIDKKLFKKRNNAAITIQKFVRGYLVRKFIWNFLMNQNPTLNTVEDIPNVDTQVTIISGNDSMPSKTTPRVSISKKGTISIETYEQINKPCIKAEISAQFTNKPVQQVSLAIQTEINNPRITTQPENQLSSFIQDEYKNWSKLDTIISQINNVIKNNKNNTQTFEDLFSQIKEITSFNVTKFKSFEPRGLNQNPLIKYKHTRSSNANIQVDQHRIITKSNYDSASSFQRTYSKTEMDVWPAQKKSEKNLLLPVTNNKHKLIEEDKFFYTDRNIKNSSKVLSQYGETISRDISKISMEDRSQLHGLKKTSKNKLLTELPDLNNPSMKILTNDYSYILIQTQQEETLKKGMPIPAYTDDKEMTQSGNYNLLKSKEAKNGKLDEDSKTKNDDSTNNKELKNCPSDLELLEVSFDYLVKSLKMSDTGISDVILDYIVEDVLIDNLWFSLVNRGAEIRLDLMEEEEAIYGIRTNINAVCEYFNMLINFISDKYLDDVSSKLIKLKLDGIDNVRFTNSTEIDLTKAVNNDRSRNRKMWELRSDPNMILSEKIYLELEAQILDNYKDMNIMDALFEMQRVYHRCIFDAYNEILTGMLFNEKNYGLNSSELKVINKDIHTESELLFILHRTKMVLLEYTMYLCGLIRDKEDSMMGQSLKNFDIESINGIREEKMFNMISKEYKETHDSREVKSRLKFEGEKLCKKVTCDIEDMLLLDVINEFLI